MYVCEIIRIHLFPLLLNCKMNLSLLRFLLRYFKHERKWMNKFVKKYVQKSNEYSSLKICIWFSHTYNTLQYLHIYIYICIYILYIYIYSLIKIFPWINLKIDLRFEREVLVCYIHTYMHTNIHELITSYVRRFSGRALTLAWRDEINLYNLQFNCCCGLYWKKRKKLLTEF